MTYSGSEFMRQDSGILTGPYTYLHAGLNPGFATMNLSSLTNQNGENMPVR
jgi:hypothetical protein